MIFGKSISRNSLVLVVSLLVGVTSGCSEGEQRPPVRPSQVPTDARWVGGVDGGDWISCQHQSGISMRCHIYADVTGVVVDSGVFITKEGHRFPVGTDLFYSNISYFDGERIKLRKGMAYERGKTE